MLNKFKSWLEKLKAESHSFNDPDDDAIHVALASLLYHIVAADGVESDKEQEKFCEIMQSEFDIDKVQVGILYAYVKEKNINLDSDLKVIQTYLKDKPVLKMQFMDKLNKLIISDGIQNNELPLFYETLKVAFPDIKIK
jgi:uncharacterized tellurite resistance protein B-like protein